MYIVLVMLLLSKGKAFLEPFNHIKELQLRCRELSMITQSGINMY